MSSMQPSSTFSFHVERSKFIDAFCGVESEIICLAKRIGVDTQKLTGQNIEALRKVSPSPKIAKATVKVIHDCLDRIATLNSVRCDIVHGQMQLHTINGDTHSVFINPQVQSRGGLVARILTISQLTDLKNELLQTSQELARLNPASSQQLPSPDAATGP